LVSLFELALFVLQRKFDRLLGAED